MGMGQSLSYHLLRDPIYHILMFTRGTRFWPIPIYHYPSILIPLVSIGEFRTSEVLVSLGWGCGGSKRAHGWSVRSTSRDLKGGGKTGGTMLRWLNWGSVLLGLTFFWIIGYYWYIYILILLVVLGWILDVQDPENWLWWGQKRQQIFKKSFAAPLNDLNAQVVLREAILSCVTPDRSRLPLLDAYVPWIKTNDFVRAPWQRSGMTRDQGHTPEGWPAWFVGKRSE